MCGEPLPFGEPLPCGEPLLCGGDITVQLPYMVINVWRAITVWELLTCETSHQSEILHSLIFWYFVYFNMANIVMLDRSHKLLFRICVCCSCKKDSRKCHKAVGKWNFDLKNMRIVYVHREWNRFSLSRFCAIFVTINVISRRKRELDSKTSMFYRALALFITSAKVWNKGFNWILFAYVLILWNYLNDTHELLNKYYLW